MPSAAGGHPSRGGGVRQPLGLDSPDDAPGRAGGRSTALDATHVAYRGAIVVNPRATPVPGPAGASLASVVAASRDLPARRTGDVFELRKTVDWGGVTIEAGQSVAVEVVDTARLTTETSACCSVRCIHCWRVGHRRPAGPEPTLV